MKNIDNTIKSVKGDFEYLGIDSSGGTNHVHTFSHIVTGIEFIYIPDGILSMGLSLQEKNSALSINPIVEPLFSRMSPVRSMSIQAFLLSRTPVTTLFAEDNIELDDNLFGPEFDDNGECSPIYLSRNEADLLCKQFNFMMPSEAQWEYFCRAGTKTLFYWGDDIPEKKVLQQTVCLSDFADSHNNSASKNPFGVVGLGIGEWCMDNFSEDYSNLPPDESVYKDAGSTTYAVGGGAAALWPWQSNYEWILCASAMRRSSSELEDSTCGLRFVKNLSSAVLAGARFG
jgi:formylglycine-generating enzyme required for sulfatase activity